MIHEYAMEPEFLFELLDKNDLASSFCRNLKPGSCCVLSDYPANMGKIVSDIADEAMKNATDSREQARWQGRKSKLIQLASSLLSQGIANRYNTLPWKGDFTPEYQRHSFAGIFLKTTQPQSQLPLHDIQWLRSLNCPFFEHPKTCAVERNSADLCTILTPLLQAAESITFVDPYFSSEPRYQTAYKSYLKAIADAKHVRSTGNTRIVQIVCAPEKRSCSLQAFQHDCQIKLQRIIPVGIELHVYCISEINTEQEIHNRYVLTDIGGVFLGHGTDPSGQPRNSLDDIAVLDSGPLAKRKAAYTPNSPAFVWSKQPIIVTP